MDVLSVYSANLAESVNAILSRVPHLSAVSTAVAFAAVWTFIKLMRMSRRRIRAPGIRGPPNPSWMYGVGKRLLEAQDPASIYESWAHEYGHVYELPGTLGSRRIVLYDPKAIGYLFSKEGVSYDRSRLAKMFIVQTFGIGLFWASGEDHRRQRKTLTPAFSIASIKKLTPIFYDSAHKTQGAWNALIESSSQDNVVVDVQNWMNHISLDSMGLAGFSHDFGALQGKQATLTVVFDTFSSTPTVSALNVGLSLMMQAFPMLSRVPTSRTRLTQKLTSAMEEISISLRARAKKEVEMGIVGEEDISIISQLIKSEEADSGNYLSEEEVISQMKVLLLAGYESTSISLTWALIELSRNPDIQIRLRDELLETGSDPTYDLLVNGLPYLDAVVHETLRLHAPLLETTRIAIEDDVIPLTQPIRTKSGGLIDNIPIAKDTIITVPMASVNCSTIIWGEDAKVFKPSRWLEHEGQNGISAEAKEVQGHRHLLTFLDGPRICLGKNFALAEFKAVLFVLVKSFMFELRDGPETEIEMGRGFLPRPRVAGEIGCKVPLRVKPYVG